MNVKDIKGLNVIKRKKVFISHRSSSYASFGLKVYTSDKRKEVLFIQPPRPTRIFNLAFLLQHLLRVIYIEDVWHLADLSHFIHGTTVIKYAITYV